MTNGHIDHVIYYIYTFQKTFPDAYRISSLSYLTLYTITISYNPPKLMNRVILNYVLHHLF